MGAMEDFLHYERLIIFKRRLADPSITDEQRQMLTSHLALEQARDSYEAPRATDTLILKAPDRPMLDQS
jgi:hypothetical protein